MKLQGKIEIPLGGGLHLLGKCRARNLGVSVIPIFAEVFRNLPLIQMQISE